MKIDISAERLEPKSCSINCSVARCAIGSGSIQRERTGIPYSSSTWRSCCSRGFSGRRCPIRRQDRFRRARQRKKRGTIELESGPLNERRAPLICFGERRETTFFKFLSTQRRRRRVENCAAYLIGNSSVRGKSQRVSGKDIARTNRSHQ